MCYSVEMQNSTLSKAIKKRRDELGHTRADLARILGVTRRATSRWELGKATPSQAVIPGLAKYLQIDTAQLRSLIDEAGLESGQVGV